MACGVAPRPAPETAPPLRQGLRDGPRPPAEEVEARASLAAQMRAYTVYHDDYARDRFYTWTSAEQLEALRAGGPLLTATATSGGRPTPYIRALDRLKEGDSAVAELARLLRDDPAFRRHRYAWISGFATVMGLGPRSYGDELIAIDLAAQAWVIKLAPASAEPIAITDLEGRRIEVAQALAEPARIGAVYHVRDQEPTPYREYVLCNPAMVRAFSSHTPQLAAELGRERRLVEAVAEEAFAWLPAGALAEPSAPLWAEERRGVDLVGLWRASLAFDNARYQPRPENLRELAARLAGIDVGGAPLSRDLAAAGLHGRR